MLDLHFLKIACLVLAAPAGAAAAPPRTTSPLSASSADPSGTALGQADAAYRLGDYSRCIDLTDSILSQNPVEHAALYLRASSRVELGRSQANAGLLREGIADAREAIRLEGKGKADYYLPYLFGMTSLAILDQKPSHAATAREVADQVLERTAFSDEEKGNIVYQRGLANAQTGDADAARADFEETISLQHSHLAAYVALANLTNSTRGPDEALAVFNRAVASIPDNSLLLNNRAMHLNSMGRQKDAMADLQAALDADSNFVPALINRAFIEIQTDDPAAADADLSTAIAKEPTGQRAYSLRGTARINLGKVREAVADYRKASQLSPGSGMAAADLGFAFFFSSDFKSALSEFNRALKLDPTISFLTPWRYAAAVRSGKDLSADPAVSLAAAQDPTKRSWFDWLTVFEMGAVSESELLAAANPTDLPTRNNQLCEAYYFIGLELLRQDHFDDARAFFEQAIATDAKRLSAFQGSRLALMAIDAKTASK